MNFTIVGAGALGTILGAHLRRAGHEVVMVARGVRAGALRRDGLRVRGLTEISLPCEVVDDPAEVRTTEVLIFAVKTYQMAAALAGLEHVQAASVVSVANGVMKNEQLAEVYGAAHVMGCMADTSGELGLDGVVEFTRNVCLNIGAYQSPTRARPEEVAAAIDEAGVVTRAVADIATVEWSKFVAWVAMFSLALVARRPTGQYLSEPSLALVAAQLVREAGAVAADKQIPLTNEAPLPVVDIINADTESGAEAIRAVGRGMLENAPTHRMSSLQDLEAGRWLEFEDTLGYLVRTATTRGLDVPTLVTCYRMAAGIDALQAAGARP